MSDDGSIDVMDFQFAPLQRCRLFDASSFPSAQRSALVVSSTYQIGIACSSSNTLVSFSTSAVHGLTVNRENVNKEHLNLDRKTVALDIGDVINGLSMNCDGTLLAVLVSNAAGAFVNIYDVTAFTLEFKQEVYRLSAVRLGADRNSKGLAVEWNPAIPDVFAASASDNTVVVAKFSPQTTTLIGSKCLGAAVNVISWSPKGKQLVVGDVLGKVSQLKQELDVVRTTMAPDLGIAGAAGPNVCGLCWLATTDWLVSYSIEGTNDIKPFILTLKKDKPASWKALVDLGYGLAQSQLPSHLSADSSLLLPWNLVVVASAKASEISVVGKRNDSWQVWSLDDDNRCDLPTDSTRNATFPLGVAIDRSSSKEVVLSEDGSAKFRPSPILLVLTTDGVLVAQNIIYHVNEAPDCQVKPVPVNLSAVCVGVRPPGTAPPPPIAKADAAPAFSTGAGAQPPAPATKSLFGAASPFAATSTTPTSFAQKPILTKTAGVSVSSSPFGIGSTPSPATGGGIGPTADISTQPPSGSSISTPTVVTAETDKKAASPAAVSKPVEEPKPSQEEVLKKRKEEVNKLLSKMRVEKSAMKEDGISLQTALGDVSALLEEAEETFNYDDSEVMSELVKVNLDLEANFTTLQNRVKHAFGNANEKMEVAELYEDDKTRIKILKKKDDFDRDERMRRLVCAMDAFKDKYADAKKMLESVSKSQPKNASHLLASGVGQDSFTKQQIKAVNRALGSLRWKLDTLEDELMRLQMNRPEGSVPSDSRSKVSQSTSERSSVNVLKTEPVPNPVGDVASMREKMRQLMIQKAKQIPKPRHLVPLPFVKNEPAKEPKTPLSIVMSRVKEQSTPKSEKTRSRLEQSLTTSPKCDASTQADAQPVVVVKEVLVPAVSTPVAPSPMQPAMSAGQGMVKGGSGKSLFGSVQTSTEQSRLTSSTPLVPSEKVPIAFPSKPSTSESKSASTEVLPRSTTGLSQANDVKSAEPTARKISEPAAKPAATVTQPAKVEVSKEDIIDKPKVDSSKPSTPVEISESCGTSGTIPEKPINAVSTNAEPTLPAPTEPTVKSDVSAISPPAGSSQTTSTPTKAEEKPEQPPKTSIFGGAAQVKPEVQQEQPQKTSIFGGVAQAKPDGAVKSSIFGGSSTPAATSASPFGSFGQATTGSTVSTPSTGTPSAFSFKPKEAAPATPGAFSFAPKPAGGAASSGFAAAAAKAAEEGIMEDDMGTESQPPASGFMRGLSLGSSSNNASSGKSVFGGVPTTTSTQAQQSSWLFGGKPAATQQQSPASGGIFGSSSQAAAKPSSFGAAASQAAQTAPVFGGGPKFGGAPAFGAKPAFSGGSAFGSASPAQQSSSVFGGGGAAASGGGFSAFAGKSTFGGAAASGGSSIFGGGAAAPAKPTSSVFGGGSATQKTNSFNTWR